MSREERHRLPGGTEVSNVSDLTRIQIRLVNQYYVDLCPRLTTVLAARSPFPTGLTTSVDVDIPSVHTKGNTLDKSVLLLLARDLAPTSVSVA